MRSIPTAERNIAEKSESVVLINTVMNSVPIAENSIAVKSESKRVLDEN